MRVIASAYACEPEKGSEPGVGWNWAKQIARFHEVWIITRKNNRPGIEAALAKDAIPNAHWIYIDLPRWASFWKKNRRGIHLYYYLWQICAYLRARKLHREIRFDLAHHLTFVNYWMPSFMFLLPIPFIWGPVGGGESAPRCFWSNLSPRGTAYEWLRHCAQRIGELDPFVKLSARRAAFVLTTTNETKGRLQKLGARRVSLVSQVGLTAKELSELGNLPTRHRGVFRVFSVGTLLHLKGFDLALMAFARFHAKHPQCEYWLFGDGPERTRLQKMANQLGVGDVVRFFGAVPRATLFNSLQEADVLLHPALHDSGGYASIEAMAAARPVICLDLGGPATQVDESNGVKLPATSPEQAVQDMATALCRLANDRTLLRELGVAARRHVQEEFGWAKKGQELNCLYSRISSRPTDRLQTQMDEATLTRLSG